MDLPWKPRPGERPLPTRELRASDDDRERVVSLLRDALGDGRITLEEHGERVDHAYRARTLGELAVVTHDLMPVEQQPVRVDATSLNAVFGSVQRTGRWVVPVRFPVSAVFGSVELDLRHALLQRRHVVIDATVLCGTIRLLVPEGVRVLVTGRHFLSSRDLRIRRPIGPDAPVIEVTGTMVAGAVRARTPKRRWRDRLPYLGR